jgi:transcriptional regulator with GAF, ATPase, and Fis domain
VEPIPETARAIEDFGPFVVEDEDLLVELKEKANQTRVLVPQLVGLSLASSEDEITFTLVATSKEIAVLDAVQYLSGGPCVEAVKAEQVLAFQQPDLLAEEAWHDFAQATAAAGVASTLTLPIISGARVVGSVNLYASTGDAFDGQHEAIAGVFGAWGPGAVTNADLSFTTRQTAERAPQQLRDDIDVHAASGVIANREGIEPESARARLREAAQRAGVAEAQLARTVIDLARLQDTD